MNGFFLLVLFINVLLIGIVRLNFLKVKYVVCNDLFGSFIVDFKIIDFERSKVI